MMHETQGMGGILGYARVSTGDQDVAGQTMRLNQAGAIKVFSDIKSGKSMDRPGLADLLAYARAGDTIAVVRLDRLGRSLRELLDIVETLKQRGIALVSLEEKIDTASAAGELVFHVFGALRISSVSSSLSEPVTVSPPPAPKGDTPDGRHSTRRSCRSP